MSDLLLRLSKTQKCNIISTLQAWIIFTDINAISSSTIIRDTLYNFIFLFDKQQYHVRHFFLHFNVDTIIRLSVILQYLGFLCDFFFYFVLRYIKKHQLQTWKGRGKKKSMVPNQFSTFQQYFTHSFSKVLRNVIMTWAWNIYRHFHWRSWHGTGDVVNSRKTGAAKWPIMEAQACLVPQEHTKQWQQWSPYNHTCRTATSCYITVFICRGLASLYVLFVYQDFNTLLNHADTWVKPSSWLANYLQKKDTVFVLFLFFTVINVI